MNTHNAIGHLKREEEDRIWDKNEINGGGLAKTDGIFASKFSVQTSDKYSIFDICMLL